MLYLCDSEAALNKVSRWIGSGPRSTLAGDANADIMTSIIECVRERVLRGARTFLVKLKTHRGEPLNKRAETQAENARQLSSECRQWTTRTQRMTYEWSDNDGVKHVTAWSKAVCSTDIGLHRIGQAASTGAQRDLMDTTRWGWSCMFNFKKRTTGKNRLPQPGQLRFYLETAKAENF